VWTFDSDDASRQRASRPGKPQPDVGDVDGDGRDEIVYGACCIDHDGKGLLHRLGHGDAMHLRTSIRTARPEKFAIHEVMPPQRRITTPGLERCSGEAVAGYSAAWRWTSIPASRRGWFSARA
jgi:hypothetical protein